MEKVINTLVFYYSLTWRRVRPKHDYDTSISGILRYYNTWYHRTFQVDIDEKLIRQFYDKMNGDNAKLLSTKIRHMLKSYCDNTEFLQTAKLFIAQCLRELEKTKHLNRYSYKDIPTIFKTLKFFVCMSNIDVNEFLMLDENNLLRHISFTPYCLVLTKLYLNDCKDCSIPSIDTLKHILEDNRFLCANSTYTEVVSFLHDHLIPSVVDEVMKSLMVDVRNKTVGIKPLHKVYKPIDDDEEDEEETVEDISDTTENETVDDNDSTNTNDDYSVETSIIDNTITEEPSKSKLEHGGCYLLQREVDYLHKNNRYKIGKGDNIMRRINHEASYRNCYIKCVIGVKDPHACEKELINTFKKMFKQITMADEGQFGAEVFEGDIKIMIPMFQAICNKYA